MAILKLRLFTLFVDGENFIGKVPSVTLPKLTRKTEDYQGGGMLGAAGVDLGLEAGALDASMIVGGVVEELILNGAAILTNCACDLWARFTAAVPAHCWKSKCAAASLRLIRVKRNRVMTLTTPTRSKTPITKSQ